MELYGLVIHDTTALCKHSLACKPRFCSEVSTINTGALGWKNKPPCCRRGGQKTRTGHQKKAVGRSAKGLGCPQNGRQLGWGWSCRSQPRSSRTRFWAVRTVQWQDWQKWVPHHYQGTGVQKLVTKWSVYLFDNLPIPPHSTQCTVSIPPHSTQCAVSSSAT